MALTGFTPINTPIAGGADIRADHLEAFRQNDILFERLLSGLLASPFVPSGGENVTAPSAEEVVFARTINLEQKIIMREGLPLIWFAQQAIHIKGEIDGAGKGARTEGDLGGSGGGGSAAQGNRCRVPISGVQLLAGGGNGAAGRAMTAADQRMWPLRLMTALGVCQGGAGGGGDRGGKGGGLVFLCAPLIVISGKIDVSGEAGGINSGGGGGGCILLRAFNISFTNEATNLVFAGGAGGTGGGVGGNGFAFKSVLKNLVA